MRTAITGLGVLTLVFASLAVVQPSAEATTVTLPLDCVLNGLPGDHGCPTNPADPFGFLTLKDVAIGQVQLTVNLAGTGQKFKNLMLNFIPMGIDFTGFTGGTLSPNSFNIPPYAGLFDIFVGNGNDLFTTTFDADQNLSVGNFLAKDSLNILYLALHIQNIGPNGCEGNDDGTTDCIPGATGEGSLKIGASNFDGVVSQEEVVVPEPAAIMLLGGGLAFLVALRLRSRRRTHT